MSGKKCNLGSCHVKHSTWGYVRVNFSFIVGRLNNMSLDMTSKGILLDVGVSLEIRYRK
jgi:hypothetical protein